MSEVPKIVALLKSDAIEKQIAAAIVLGELKAKAPGTSEALAQVLQSGVPLLQVHALDALARIGAKKALPAIFEILAEAGDDVRRAAVRAIASVGDEAVPLIKKRMVDARPEERRALDAALAGLGGRDAFGTLLAGLASSDAEASQAAAVAMRQQIKAADGRTRRSYLVATENFLEAGKKKKDKNASALAAAVKILGYLEDEKSEALLLRYLTDEKEDPSVRKEAIIALRFALEKSSAGAKVTEALVKAAGTNDRMLAQAALHTLGMLKLGADGIKRLEPLTSHPELERGRFVIELLARNGSAESLSLLTKVLLTTADKRYAELAQAALTGKEAAATELAKALLTSTDRDRAWTIRNVLRAVAKKIPAAIRKQLLATAIERLGKSELGWEALLDVCRDADPDAAAIALRELAQKIRKKNEDKALTVLRLLAKTDKASDDDRYLLASLELAKSVKDTRAASRASDESLRILTQLVGRGFDVAKAMKKDKGLELDSLYYAGFHFTETGHPLGDELLEHVVDKGGRTKIGKAAKNKLALANGE